MSAERTAERPLDPSQSQPRLRAAEGADRFHGRAAGSTGRAATDVHPQVDAVSRSGARALGKPYPGRLSDRAGRARTRPRQRHVLPLSSVERLRISDRRRRSRRGPGPRARRRRAIAACCSCRRTTAARPSSSPIASTASFGSGAIAASKRAARSTAWTKAARSQALRALSRGAARREVSACASCAATTRTSTACFEADRRRRRAGGTSLGDRGWSRTSTSLPSCAKRARSPSSRFEDAIRAMRTGKSEREIEAAFWSRARIDANDTGYLTIAAAAEHACTLALDEKRRRAARRRAAAARRRRRVRVALHRRHHAHAADLRTLLTGAARRSTTSSGRRSAPASRPSSPGTTFSSRIGARCACSRKA